MFADQLALTPLGKPFAPDTPAFAIPVAPVVVCVIAVNAVLIHKLGAELATLTVLLGLIVIVPVAVLPEHAPVRGIE